MRRIISVFGFLFILLISFTISAQSKVVVLSTISQSAAEKKLADEIDSNLLLLFSTIRDARLISEKDALTPAQRSKISRCGNNLKCVVQVASGADGIDYIVTSRLQAKRGQGVKVAVSIYDKNMKRLGGKPVTAGDEADGEDLASDIIGILKRLVADNASGGGSAASSSSSSSGSSRKKLSSYTEVKNEIIKGFNAYDKGDVEAAAEIFERAGSEMTCNCSQNDVAKSLSGDIDKIRKGLPKASDSINANDYRTALRALEVIKKADENIRDQGYKYMVFKKDRTIRHRYLEPNPKDAQAVDQIHKGFNSKIDAARKWKAKQLLDIDKWVNDNIKSREKDIDTLKEQEKLSAKNLKDAEDALKKKIQEMKYQWEKDDGSLEAEIVNLESQITQIEQREKGVIKTSNKKREAAKDKELKDHDKAYSDWKALFQKEKDTFYDKHKNFEKVEGENITKKLTELEKKKQALEEKNKEVDAEIQKMVEEFEKEERKIMAANESVKMKNEDEDRKYNVVVEKEYQKSFDELNQKLAKYDDQEAQKTKDLEKFDREIEDFMVKNANAMGKIQEDIEKERTKIEAEYAKVKTDMQQKVEKEYETNLNKLIAEKSKLEEAVSRHTDETENLKSKKEEELIKANEKDISTADQKLMKNEEAIGKIEQEYETKIIQIQEAIAKTTDVEESEKVKKENELRAKSEKLLSEMGSIEEKIAIEDGRFEETKGKIEDEYAGKTAALEDKVMALQNKKVETSENFRASWGDFVSKEVDKLTAEDNKLRSQIEVERAKIAEIDGKYDQQKMKELDKLDAKLNNIEDVYSKKTLSVDEDVAKEIEAVKAETMKQLEKAASDDAAFEEAFNKKMTGFASEEQKIAASFDGKIGKLDGQVAAIDKTYDQKMAPFNVDSIVDKMNQAVAELDNQKVEEINKQQELLDAIAQAKSSAEQNYDDRKVALKDNKVELSKLERDHSAAMRKMEVDEKSAERKIDFSQASYDRKIKFEKAKYERDIEKNKGELQKLEREKNLELITINKEIATLNNQKKMAIAGHQKKTAAENSSYRAQANTKAAAAKKISDNGQARERQIAGSVKARKAAVNAEKSAEIKTINAEKANINNKYKALAEKEKGEVRGKITQKQKQIADNAKEIKVWEIKINKVDPVKLKEVTDPIDKQITELQKQKGELVKEKAGKITALTQANKQVVADLTAKKNEAIKGTQGVDLQVKNEHAAIAKKYSDVRSKMNTDIANLQKEKGQKISVLKTENGATLKQKALTENGFKKNLTAEIKKLALDRNKQLVVLKASLAKTSKELAVHEKSHDQFVQNEISKIDAKYEKMLTELDMKLGSENQRLQNENKSFTATKKQEKAIAEKQFKLFLAEKAKFKAGNDNMIKQAQSERDKKIELRRAERNKLQLQWTKEKDMRTAAFDRKTAGLKDRLASNNKQIDLLAGEIDNVNNVGARKLEEMKAKNHNDGKKQDALWMKTSAVKEKWYEDTKKAITDKYDNMELGEKKEREAQKVQMMAKRDKLLIDKDKRKERRTAVLEKEKVIWDKNKEKFTAQIEKLKNEIDKLNSQKGALIEKDKEGAKVKKDQVQKKYEETIGKINDAELKMVKEKFNKEYDEEAVREVQTTGVTKKIESIAAEAYAKSGLEKLEKNDIALARKDFVEALFVDKNNKTAKEGLKAISAKAQAMFWEASGAKDSNKTKSIRTLEMLMKSLLPTDEIYLKSMLLMEELK